MTATTYRERAYAAARRAIAEERAFPCRGIDRCPHCGAWRYLGQCWTPLPACLGEAIHDIRPAVRR